MHRLSVRIISKLFLFAFLLIFSSTINAQNNERPKVGLVLSGGGAKGIAHIGVLKAMEKAGLTPDYITGTSMGSIIGGLYAIGYSAEDLEKLVLTAKWNELLTNKIPFNKVTYEEKEYHGRYLLDFYFKNWEPQIPRGIIEGQGLNQLFSDLTRPVQDVDNFSNLPIPFKCVAADIVTGKPVVLDHGSLAMSMRASMAIPSVFTPVRIDTHLLVDGGILRNMPAQEVIDMGADIVIGVFVSTDLDPEEDLNSAIAILSQTAFINSAFDSRKQLELCDYLITPNLKGFSTGSFSEAAGILDSGETAGERSYNYFKNLSDSLNQFGPNRKKPLPEAKKSYNFQKIEIYGANHFSEEYIRKKLGFKLNTQLSIDEINANIDLLYGTLYFIKLRYEIVHDGEDEVLKVYLTERPRKQLRFSYHYDSENKGGILANLTFRNVLLKNSRFVFEADLSSFPRLTVDYLKYLGLKKTLAFQLIGKYSKNELPSFDAQGNTVSIFSTTTYRGGMRLQTTKFQNGAFGIEAFQSKTNLKPKIVDSTLRQINSLNYTSTKFSLFHRLNSYNDRYFPTRGISSEAIISTTLNLQGDLDFEGLNDEAEEQVLEGVLRTDDIQSVEVTFTPVIPLNDRFSVILKSRLKISTLEPNKLNLDEYDLIGGFTPRRLNSIEFYGLNIDEFVSSNFFYGRTSLQYNINRKFFFLGHLNILETEKIVSAIYKNVETSNFNGNNLTVGYGASVGYSSPLGPISVSIAKEHSRDAIRAAFSIGFYY